MLYYVTIIVKSYKKLCDSKLFYRIEKDKFFFLTNIGRKLLIVDKKVIIMIVGKKVIIMMSLGIIGLL